MDFRAAQEPNMDGIEIRRGEIPELDRAEIFERYGMGDCFCGCSGRRDFLAAFGDDADRRREVRLRGSGAL